MMTATMERETPATSSRWRSYHEAGHAVMAIIVGHEFDSVDITPGTTTDQRANQGGLRNHRTKKGQSLTDHVRVGAGGVTANRLAYESIDFSELDLQEQSFEYWAKKGSEDDGVRSLKLVREHIPDLEEARRTISDCMHETERVLKIWWPAVVLVAEELAAKGSLTFEDVKRIVRGGKQNV